MSLIQSLINENALVLMHDYRSRDVTDKSGNGNDGVMTDTEWTGQGIQFPASTSKIVVADSAELQLTGSGTLIVFGDFAGQTSSERLISKRDAGGTNYDLLISATNVELNDGTNWRTKATTVTGKKYLGLNVTSGQSAEVFLDGISDGNLASTSSFVANDADLIVGNIYTGGNQLKSNLKAVLIINRALTASEHSILYGELSAIHYPTKPTTHEKDFRPDELIDGDMEASGVGAWTPSPADVLTKEESDLAGGSQCLRIAYGGNNYPKASQAVLTIGNTYRATGYARATSGGGYPRFSVGGVYFWTGTTSTDWQYFDETFIATATSIEFYYWITSAGSGEFDNIQVIDLGKTYPAKTFHTDWGVNESKAAISSGQLENSPFTVQSGSFKISTDTIDNEDVKVIECVTNGICSIPTSEFHQTNSESAYGEWEWYQYSDTANSTVVLFVQDTAADATSGNNYNLIHRSSDNTIDLRQIGTTRLDTGAYPKSTWTKIKVTRDSTGLFEVFIDDVSKGTVTQATYTTSKYIVFDIDAGDKIALSSITGNNSIIKKL